MPVSKPPFPGTLSKPYPRALAQPQGWSPVGLRLVRSGDTKLLCLAGQLPVVVEPGF
jgi:hypothetical protein